MQALIKKWINNFKQNDVAFSLRQIKNQDEWAEAKESSKTQSLVLFKHSNRCSISDLALRRILQIQDEINELADFYIIDVIRERNLSQKIAEELKVRKY